MNLKLPRGFSLSHKIILSVLIGLLLQTLVLARNAEDTLEQAIFQQIIKQVRVMLRGVEQEIRRLPDPTNRQEVDAILKKVVVAHHRGEIDFYPNQLYLYSRDGIILAHTDPGEHPAKDMSQPSYYADVIHHDRPYTADQFEEKWDEATKTTQTVIDVIIPIHGAGGEVIGGLEAEINLDRTMQWVGTLDRQFEQEIFQIAIMSALAFFLFLWWIMHRLVIRHANQFDRVTRAIAEGDLTRRVTGRLPADELGRLGQSVNFMADRISRLIREQEEAYLQTLQSLAKALEAKDAYTVGHSGRVAKYSVLLGQRLKLSDTKLELLKRGALMHDLGKIGIADGILNKPGPLTEAEFSIMRTHPTITATIMRPLQRFKEFAEIAAWHHERWDGGGYPDGLKGEETPLLARIVAIADTWDAMTGDRIYRQGMSLERALGIFEKELDGGQWDPELVRQFVRMIREQELGGP